MKVEYIHVNLKKKPGIYDSNPDIIVAAGKSMSSFDEYLDKYIIFDPEKIESEAFSLSGEFEDLVILGEIFIKGNKNETKGALYE